MLKMDNKLKCIKDVFNKDKDGINIHHSFTKDIMYEQIHSSEPIIIRNNFGEEHQMSIEFKEEHFV